MGTLGTVSLILASLAIGIGVGIGSGYAVWGRSDSNGSSTAHLNSDDLDPQSSGKEDKWIAAVADAPRTIMMDSEQAEGNRETYSYTISWDVMQSYGYKNMLFDKQFVFGRDPPDWDQTSLISGASRNEAAATLSRAALMDDDDINTAQLPYRFNFTLVRPVFVGDVEEFSATIQYLYTNNSSSSNSDLVEAEGSACGHAIVSGTGTVNGTVHTITTISYKCMHDQPDRLSEKGYRLREANGPEL